LIGALSGHPGRPWSAVRILALFGALLASGTQIVYAHPRRADRLSSQTTRLSADCTTSCRGPNGTGEVGGGRFGESVAISEDGRTALIGEPFDRGQPGAVYVFVRRHRSWTQQGPKLVADCTSSCGGPNGTGEVSDNGDFGMSVALSADGNTALIGAGEDNDEEGAAWVFTRHHGVWSQQGPKLIGDCTSACGGPNGTGETHAGDFGDTVALSGDGRTALIGVPGQDPPNLRQYLYGSPYGAAWVFVRRGGSWSQRGTPLLGTCTAGCGGPNGTGETGPEQFGGSVAMSANGRTALIGATHGRGAWVFTRRGGLWSQQGAKLIGDCTNVAGCDADSVALSARGNVALLGQPGDGGVRVFARRHGQWSQQGSKLVGDCTSSCGGPRGTGAVGSSLFGSSVALSDRGDVALIGAPFDNNFSGAVWEFTRRRHTWNQAGAKLVGGATASPESPCCGFGDAVALSGDASTALLSAPSENDQAGVVYVFGQPR
jgi:hypothetical protein